MNGFEDYTDEELAKLWNNLEAKILTTPYVENKMEDIYKELIYRGVTVWNDKGEITERVRLDHFQN